MSEGEELQGESGGPQGLQRHSVDSPDPQLDSQLDSQVRRDPEEASKPSNQEMSNGVTKVQEDDVVLKNGCLEDHGLNNGNLAEPELDNEGSTGDPKAKNAENGELELGNGTVGDSKLDNGALLGDPKCDNGDPDDMNREKGAFSEGKESGDEMAKDTKSEDTVDTAGASHRESWPGHRGDKDDDEEGEGVDPFSMKPGPEDNLNRQANRKGKSVVFKEPEEPLQNGNSLSSPSSSSSTKEKGEEEEEEGEMVDGETVERRSGKQWTLGEGNPVYRLSMKLSPNLFNMMDIPAANQHQDADKAGYLNKLSGRSFPYIPQWKRRYCVLSKGRLYYYEREDSRQGEKSNGVINLEYFDQVNEAAPKDCKKATNVFIITSQDRSFFDPGRHLFSADTLPDMKDWIRRLHGALEQIRNNNRPAAANSSNSSGMESGKKRKEESGAESKEDKDNKENQLNSSTRERKKKKEDSHRSRKSARTTTGVSSETQTTITEPQPPPATDHEPTATKGATTTTGGPASPKGGIQLPGFSAFKPKLEEKLSLQLKTKEEVTKRTSQGDEDMPSAGPTLTSVTKHRVRGPQGRRAPQSNRRTTMAVLKKRASSLSALEHQDSLDTRSESSQSGPGSFRHSGTPDWDMKEEMEPLAEEGTPERQISFDDIDDDLFFKPLREVVGREDDGDDEGGRDNNNTKKDKKRNSNLRVRIEEQDKRRSASRSRNGTLGSKLSRFSETMASFKPSRFKSKEPIGPDHPDQVDHSRWTCVVL